MTSSPVNLDKQPPKFEVEPLTEPSPRWIRVKFGGKIIADSKRAMYLRQFGPGRLPTYYFPQADVRLEHLIPGSIQGQVEGKHYLTVKVGDKLAESTAWIYAEPPARLAALKDYVTFQWDKMESWYEEEEQIFVHARDPYHRVDVLGSSRHVQVVIEGQPLADTCRPSLLFETHLPTR